MRCALLSLHSIARCSVLFICCLCLLSFFPQIHGEIIQVGDVPYGTWTSDTVAYIGKTSDGSVIVEGGSEVVSKIGFIGYFTGATGAMTVDGTNSTWTNSTHIYIGHEGNGSLDINGGGAVVNNSWGFIGYKSGSTGAVTVDGIDSMWTNSGSLLVGDEGDGTLDITGGGTVSNAQGFIGHESGATGAVTVDGTGATWTNRSEIYVGHEGNGTLDITDGGVVNVARDTWVGYGDLSSGVINFDNGTLVTDGLLCALNDLAGTGTINTHGLVSDVDLVFDAVNGLNQTFHINNNPAQSITVNISAGGFGAMGAGYDGAGTMGIFDGIRIESFDGYIGYKSGSTGAVTVNGIDSTWANSGDLYVGQDGSGTLDITGGGVVTVACDTFVGRGERSSSSINFSNGTLETGGLLCALDDLAGTGTITTCGLVSDIDLVFDAAHGLDQTFHIRNNPGQNISVNLSVDGSGAMGAGYSGLGTMSINSRRIESTNGYIGYKSGSAGVVTVNGFGSKWTNDDEVFSRSNLYVGYRGSGTLDITGGGDVCDDDGYIGYSSGSTGVVSVSGSGSTWINRNDFPDDGYLYVGYNGSGTLDITDGGQVSVGDFSGTSYIGYASGSTGVVTVNGTGSKWVTGDDFFGRSNLFVGYGGNGTLDITGGGTVCNDYGHIGYQSGSTGVVTVNGIGSTWSNNDNTSKDSDLFIGTYGSGTLDITGGGAVSNDCGYIGHSLGSTGVVTVNGIGSIWTNSNNNSFANSEIYVGRAGSGTLNITGGGTVISDCGYIGLESGATGAVTVDGIGSTWTNSSDLRVGRYGNGTLDITGGGVLSNGSASIGQSAGATGAVTVDGTGSTWTNSSGLNVGSYGNGTLDITGGGALSNSYSSIGQTAGSTGAVTVDGTGSTWTNSSDLYVGREGNGTLDITGGSTVSSRNGHIGFGLSWRPMGTGTVTVDGTGSIWTNSTDLYVAYYGNGTLDITDGGLVTVGGTLTIDYDDDGDGFINMTTEGMLALYGDADGSLSEFLELISGTDAIRYWDYAIADWADITEATYGEDYSLVYLTDGDLSGYTLLTVGMSEPSIVGDANCDGVVDDSDAGVLARYWQTAKGAVWGMGDFNKDGAVDDIDATLLATNWQLNPEGAVPEPSTLTCLLGLFLAGLLIPSRRKP